MQMKKAHALSNRMQALPKGHISNTGIEMPPNHTMFNDKYRNISLTTRIPH